MHDFSDLGQRFSRIYSGNEWGGGSGPGAAASKNKEYIHFVSEFIERNDVRSVLDFGCGDWQFSRYIDWRGVKYTGVDVVEAVVDSNRRAFAGPGINFELVENPRDLPSAELLISKDVFQHLPNAMVSDCLRVFKENYRLMLITNDDYPNGTLNRDIDPGGWRPLRLEREPFSENAAIVLSWIVQWRPGLARKVTYLLYGSHSHPTA